MCLEELLVVPTDCVQQILTEKSGTLHVDKIGIHDEDLQRLKCFSVRFGLQRSRAAATQTHVALRLARNVLEEEAVWPENSSSQAELRLALLERADEQALLSSNCLGSRNKVRRMLGG
jgi:hypothetical protein